VDKFVQTARRRYPKAYIHFVSNQTPIIGGRPNPFGQEDFGLHNARRILDRYTPQMACFNDDVQGTGCVTLAAVRSALHISKTKMEDLRVVMFGAGTAGTGIADQLLDAISVETKRSKEEAGLQIWLVFIVFDRNDPPTDISLGVLISPGSC
jgi:malate dehydrogenase (oxaloacetate-decarboxylating)